ncbi:tumor necrosis factor ligand superfamily member 14-like [Brachyistius frenatus]|uniref:tumor necrosis factor ligand superfamily member 14-like n=1 Tax=Brachyistius frenatus TaxID=100188 RepID=UPI0037E84E1E
MSEGGAATCPQVFVVDSWANHITVPGKKEPRWARVGRKLLLPLVGLVALGLIVEGYLIYNLYQKTEAFSVSRPHPHIQNFSSPKISGQESGIILSQVGSKESNEIPRVLTQTQKRPFAHLLGPNNALGENNVVQWIKEGEAFTQNMEYDKGQLIIEEKGYYYLYSKVQVNAVEECLLIQHRVMKNTSAYGHPIELMKSKSFRCWTPKREKASEMEDLWNSFLAGIYHLESGDKIFVTLDNIQKMRLGLTENFMGAFMVSS